MLHTSVQRPTCSRFLSVAWINERWRSMHIACTPLCFTLCIRMKHRPNCCQMYLLQLYSHIPVKFGGQKDFRKVFDVTDTPKLDIMFSVVHVKNEKSQLTQDATEKLVNYSLLSLTCGMRTLAHVVKLSWRLDDFGKLSDGISR